jgi:hypothetical protein
MNRIEIEQLYQQYLGENRFDAISEDRIKSALRPKGRENEWKDYEFAAKKVLVKSVLKHKNPEYINQLQLTPKEKELQQIVIDYYSNKDNQVLFQITISRIISFVTVATLFTNVQYFVYFATQKHKLSSHQLQKYKTIGVVIGILSLCLIVTSIWIVFQYNFNKAYVIPLAFMSILSIGLLIYSSVF